MLDFSERMREARIAANATQRQVADAVRVTSVAVSRWENGFSKNLKMAHLFAVARYLGCSPEWLATGRGNRSPKSEPGKAPESADPRNTAMHRLVADEREWLALYRALPKNRRRALLKSMSVFLCADDIPTDSEN